MLDGERVGKGQQLDGLQNVGDLFGQAGGDIFLDVLQDALLDLAFVLHWAVQRVQRSVDAFQRPLFQKGAAKLDFIGDSNIVDGVMHKDFLVSFSGVQFPCVDRGFAREQSVQVVVRPEDIEVVSPMEGQLVGVVNDVIFKGVHFEMHVDVEGREWLIHSTRACTPGETIGMRIGPNEIHIMARS